MSIQDLPLVNALLNSCSALLLATGYVMIRRGKVAAHRAIMISALAMSALFLTSYLIYHAHVGTVHFMGTGVVRPIYFSILTTHTILAVVIVPLVAITITRSLRRKFARHKAIARWTLPLWFYVSFTGVVIYVMLYRLYPPAG
jgi:putative membrane protein